MLMNRWKTIEMVENVEVRFPQCWGIIPHFRLGNLRDT